MVVHTNVLRDWRTQALKGLPTIFDRRDDRAAFTTYFTFYNQERPHQALDYQTPAALYQQCQAFDAQTGSAIH